MIDNLIRNAKKAAQKAYCPYSNFRVGAAVLTEDNSIFLGCNVENASYGLTVCAERSAIFTMVAANQRNIKAIAIYTPTKEITAPCGACRQVIREFASEDIPIYMVSDGDKIETSLGRLLPLSFGPENLRL